MDTPPTPFLSIEDAFDKYLKMVREANSAGTAVTYGKAIRRFGAALEKLGQPPCSTEVDALSVDAITGFIQEISALAAPTRKLYVSAVSGFYSYLAAENHPFNLARLRMLIKKRLKKNGARELDYPMDEMEQMIAFADGLKVKADKMQRPEDPLKVRAWERSVMILLRDRALMLVLADTGLRVHEACKLRRGDIDASTRRALVIGKGDKQAWIRFSDRSLKALKDYYRFRTSILDGKAGRPLSSLPVFLRHDRAGTDPHKLREKDGQVLSLTTVAARKIVAGHLVACFGREYLDENEIRIHPHTFRHRFVTEVLKITKNLKLTQELARHSNIAITQRYAHLSGDELDAGYSEVFEHRRKRSGD